MSLTCQERAIGVVPEGSAMSKTASLADVVGFAEADELVKAASPRPVLANMVKLTHVSIVFTVSWGWLMPWQPIWWLNTFGIPMMILHWITNDKVCFLTTLEDSLRGDERAGTPDQAPFMPRLAAIFGITISEDLNTKLAYSVSIFSWCVCVGRIAWLHLPM